MNPGLPSTKDAGDGEDDPDDELRDGEDAAARCQGHHECLHAGAGAGDDCHGLEPAEADQYGG